MRNLVIFALFAVMLSTSVVAQRRYVDASSPSGGDGDSWSTAFDRLQDALAAAGPGAEIWVAEGTYQGGFSVPAGVQLRGGFRSGDTRESQRDPVAHRTILDGGGTQRGLGLGDKCLVDGFEWQIRHAAAAQGHRVPVPLGESLTGNRLLLVA